MFLLQKFYYKSLTDYLAVNGLHSSVSHVALELGPDVHRQEEEQNETEKGQSGFQSQEKKLEEVHSRIRK